MKKIVSVCLAGILLLCYSIYVFDARNPESMSGQRGGGTAGFTYLYCFIYHNCEGRKQG